MFQVGDVIRPREGKTPLKVDHYEVTNVGSGAAHLVPLCVHRECDDDPIKNCLVFIPRELLAMFDRVSAAEQ